MRPFVGAFLCEGGRGGIRRERVGRRTETYLCGMAVQENNLADGLTPDRSGSDSSALRTKPAKQNKTKGGAEEGRGEMKRKRKRTHVAGSDITPIRRDGHRRDLAPSAHALRRGPFDDRRCASVPGVYVDLVIVLSRVRCHVSSRGVSYAMA